MKCFLTLVLSAIFITAYSQDKNHKSGNPIFEGWYADPEVAIYNNKYWIFPTFSAPFEKQVFFRCIFVRRPCSLGKASPNTRFYIGEVG